MLSLRRAASSSTTSSIGTSIGSSGRSGQSRRDASARRGRPRSGAACWRPGWPAARPRRLAAGGIALAIALAGPALRRLGQATGAPSRRSTWRSCRALNLMLGVAAVPAALSEAWPIAAVPLLYIYAVTVLSRGEVHGGSAARRVVCADNLGDRDRRAVAGGDPQPASDTRRLVLAAAVVWRVVPAFVAARRQPVPGDDQGRGQARRSCRWCWWTRRSPRRFAGPLYRGGRSSSPGLVAGWLARTFAVT